MFATFVQIVLFYLLDAYINIKSHMIRHNYSSSYAAAISFLLRITGRSSTCPLSMRLARLRWLSVQSMTSLTRTKTGHRTTWPFMCGFLFYYTNNGVQVVSCWQTVPCSCTCSSSHLACCPWWVSYSLLWALAASNLVLLPLVEINLVNIRWELSSSIILHFW